MRLPLEALEIVSGSFLNVTMNNCLQRELDQRLSIKQKQSTHINTKEINIVDLVM
jgi:hypothetical protein